MSTTAKEVKATVNVEEERFYFELEWRIHFSIFERAEINEQLHIIVPDIQSQHFGAMWRLQLEVDDLNLRYDLRTLDCNLKLLQANEELQILECNGNIKRLRDRPESYDMGNLQFSVDFFLDDDNIRRFTENGYFVFQWKVNARLVRTNINTHQLNSLELLSSGLLSDVTLVVNQKEFNVHRAILAAHSDYFKAMFTSNFKESAESRIFINEVKVDIFQKLLEFIYSQKLPTDLENSALDLFVVADKYGLGSLADICRRYLQKNVCFKNCVDLLMMADQYALEELRDKVIRFMVKNIESVIQLETWKNLKIVNPTMTTTILEQILEKNRDKNKI